MMSHQKKGIHPRPCGIINLSNIISYGRGTLPYLIELYLSIAGIVIIVVTIVTGLEIRKISKEINEIDIKK